MGLFDKIKGKIQETVNDQISDFINPDDNKKEEQEQEQEASLVDDGRPSNVPSQAIWNTSNGEWELGNKDEDGTSVGEWTWWREDGSICCKTNFEEGSNGQNFVFERFHEDGTYSQKGAYINGVQDGTFYYQGSNNATTERVMEQAPAESIFKFEFDWSNGKVVATRQWDVEGNELNQKGNPLNMKKPESVDEAAIFNEDYNEYQLEKYDELGKPTGVHKYWRANGVVFEEITYVNGSKSAVRQYHPTGNLAVEVLYQDNCTRFKSRILIDEANSDIEFNRNNLADEVVKKEYCFDELGFMTSWKGYDENGLVVVEELLNLNIKGNVNQLTFDSVDEASASWNQRGDQFYKEMNHFIDQYYVEGHPQVAHEPFDDRSDMERYMIHQIIKMNKEEKLDELNVKFNPSTQPFSNEFWLTSGKSITNLALTNDFTYVTVQNEVYKMTNSSKEKVAGTIFTSISNGHLIHCAKEGINVCDLETDNVLFQLAYPKKYNDEIRNSFPNLNQNVLSSFESISITAVELCLNNKSVVLATDRGIFILTEESSSLIFPTNEQLNNEVKGEDYMLSLINSNLSISQDGQLLNCTAAVQDGLEYTSVFSLNNIDKTITHLKSGHEQQMYITNSVFNNENALVQGRYQRPDGYGRGDVTYLLGIPAENFKEGSAGIVTDETPSYYNFMGEVQALDFCKEQLFAATGKKYVWTNFVPGSDGSIKYFFLGGDMNFGKVSSIGFSPDGKTIAVATDYGCVHNFKVAEEPKLRSNYISNMNLESQKMFMFLHHQEPLIW